MRIGINALLLSSPRAGIGNYIYNLVKYLAKKKDQELILFGQKESFPPELGKAKAVEPWVGVDRSWQRILWEQLVLPWQSREADIIHYPDYAMPVLCKARPSVITIHDLSFLRYPETFTLGSRLTKKVLAGPSVLKADKIIADSESTKRDLMEFFGINEEKIAVIYLGIDQEVFQPMSRDEARGYLLIRYNLTEPFFLFIGTLEPRKNLTTLIRAYSLVKKALGPGCPKLVLGGGKGWLYQEIFAVVKELDLAGDVIFPGYIPDRDLPYFYNAAEIFIYPSLYEGFGLPTLEAMACGTPVITSNVSSLPEVVGEGGLMVDPGDIQGFAGLMEKVYRDRELRADLSRKGLRQAAKFSWEETADETLAVYREVLLRWRDSR